MFITSKGENNIKIQGKQERLHEPNSENLSSNCQQVSYVAGFG